MDIRYLKIIVNIKFKIYNVSDLREIIVMVKYCLLLKGWIISKYLIVYSNKIWYGELCRIVNKINLYNIINIFFWVNKIDMVFVKCFNKIVINLKKFDMVRYLIVINVGVLSFDW